jgi:hypothetical protein
MYSSGDARTTLKGAMELALAFVGLRTGPLFPLIKPVRIPPDGDDVMLASVFGWKCLEVADLKFSRRQVFGSLGVPSWPSHQEITFQDRKKFGPCGSSVFEEARTKNRME